MLRRLMRAASRSKLLIACVLAAALLSGCGSGATTRAREQGRAATLILDFTPNAVHTGIYAALGQHYDRDAGVNLHVIAPTASTDSSVVPV